MKSRYLFILLGMPIIMAFQNAGKSIKESPNNEAIPTSNLTDSTSTMKKKPIKEVKSDKTKIHHVKKVESNLPKTIN